MRFRRTILPCLYSVHDIPTSMDSKQTCTSLSKAVFQCQKNNYQDEFMDFHGVEFLFSNSRAFKFCRNPIKHLVRNPVTAWNKILPYTIHEINQCQRHFLQHFFLCQFLPCHQYFPSHLQLHFRLQLVFCPGNNGRIKPH